MSKLAELRKNRNATLAAVSKTVGVDVGNLSRIERGQQFPRPVTAGKLATYYGISVSELYRMVLPKNSKF